MSIKRTSLAAVLTLLPAGIQAQLSSQTNTQAVAALPLSSHPQGQAMMAEAARKAALLDVTFTFLDKEYKDDTYATDPFGNKYRTGCYRFKVNSGFRFRMDTPQFTLNNQGLTIVQNISRISGDGLTARAMLLACQEFGIGTIGVRVSDLKVTYTSRPLISFSQAGGGCTIGWNQDTDDVRVTIGDLNITNVQNDLDKLAKNAVEDAVNFTLGEFFGSMLRRELIRVAGGVCGQPATRR